MRNTCIIVCFLAIAGSLSPAYGQTALKEVPENARVVTLIRNDGTIYRTIGDNVPWVQIRSPLRDKVITYVRNNGERLKTIDGGGTWVKLTPGQIATATDKEAADPAGDVAPLLKVFPNPSNNPLVTIEISGISRAYAPTLKLYDLEGRLLLDLTAQLPQPLPSAFYFTYDLGKLQAGAYYLKLSSGTNTVSEVLTVIK